MAIEFILKRISQIWSYGERSVVKHEDYNNAFNLLIEQGNNNAEGVKACADGVNELQDQITGISQGSVADDAIVSSKIATAAVQARHLDPNAFTKFASKRQVVSSNANFAQSIYEALAAGATSSKFRNTYATKNAPTTQASLTVAATATHSATADTSTYKFTLAGMNPIVASYTKKNLNEIPSSLTGIFTLRFTPQTPYTQSRSIRLRIKSAGNIGYYYRLLPSMTGNVTVYYTDGTTYTFAGSETITQGTLYDKYFILDSSKVVSYVEFKATNVTLTPYVPSSRETLTTYFRCDATGEFTADSTVLVYQSPKIDFTGVSGVEIAVQTVTAPTVSVSSAQGLTEAVLYKSANGFHYYFCDLSGFINDAVIIFTPPVSGSTPTTGYYIAG